MEEFQGLEEFANYVIKTINEMDTLSRDALVAMLREQLRLDAPTITVDPDSLCCPVCGSKELVKNGHTRKSTQHRVCKDCGRTRCAGAGPIMLHTKLPYEKWYAYIPMFIDRLSSPKVAERLHVQPRTAWFMRIRVLEALYKNLPAFQVISGSSAQFDEIYFRESFKGTRFENMENPPREPRHERTEGTVKSGISNDQICVVTGVDDVGQFMYDVICRGPLTIDAAKACLEGKVDQGTFVVTDRNRPYIIVLKGLGTALHQAVSSKVHSKLESINHIHSNIRTFIAPFRGVSTKWLPMYLCWFKWLRCYDRGGKGIDICLRQTFVGSYDHTYRGIKTMPLPFRDAMMNPLKYATS